MTKNWKKQLRDEFGIHFKDCPDELKFLETFISDLLKDKETWSEVRGYDLGTKHLVQEIEEFIKKFK